MDELNQSGMLYVSRIHGCAFGLQDSKGRPLKKPWQIISTKKAMAQALQRRCPGHHQHGECMGGSESRRSEHYPQALCDVIQKVAKELANNTENGIFPVFDSGVLAESKKVEAFPLNDAEKKNAEKLLSKLHLRTGHPSNTALAGTLRHRGAHPEVIEMAKRHQ